MAPPGAVAVLCLLLCLPFGHALCDNTWQISTFTLCPISMMRYCWNVTGDSLIMQVQARTSGWISFGLMQGRSKTGPVDMVYFYLDDATGEMRGEDYYMEAADFSSGRTLHSVPKRDTQQDVEVLAWEMVTFTTSDKPPGLQEGDYTAVTFKKKWSTGDTAHDLAINPFEKHYSIWATRREPTGRPVFAGDQTSFLTHHPSNSWSASKPGGGPGGNKGYKTLLLADDYSHTLDCDYYCTLQMTACGDIQEEGHQFNTEGECLAMCSTYLSQSVWGVGDPESPHESDNTMLCRIGASHRAEVAPADNDALTQQLCNEAGPTGGGVCGSYCEIYCGYMAAACESTDTQACLADCALFGAEDDSHTGREGSSCAPGGGEEARADPRYGVSGFPYYNTAACRATRASLAFRYPASPDYLVMGPEQQCGLAALDSPACCDSSVPACDHYCQEVMLNCGAGGPKQQFSSTADCLGWCAAGLSLGSGGSDLGYTGGDTAAFGHGKHTDVVGNTLGCRTHLAMHAASLEECLEAKQGVDRCVENPTVPGPPTAAPTPGPVSTAPCTGAELFEVTARVPVPGYDGDLSPVFLEACAKSIAAATGTHPSCWDAEDPADIERDETTGDGRTRRGGPGGGGGDGDGGRPTLNGRPGGGGGDGGGDGGGARGEGRRLQQLGEDVQRVFITGSAPTAEQAGSLSDHFFAAVAGPGFAEALAAEGVPGIGNTTLPRPPAVRDLSGTAAPTAAPVVAATPAPTPAPVKSETNTTSFIIGGAAVAGVLVLLACALVGWQYRARRAQGKFQAFDTQKNPLGEPDVHVAL